MNAMKQIISIIIYSIILSCLFAEDRIQKKAIPEDLSSKALPAAVLRRSGLLRKALHSLIFVR